MKWVWTIIASGIIGRVTTWTVWMAIYAPGTRVISDEQHVLYSDSVVWAGTIVGCAIGTILRQLAKYPVLSTMLVHTIAFLVFLFIPLNSWRQGLASYSGGLILGLVATLTVILALERKGKPNKGVVLTATRCAARQQHAPDVRASEEG